jgi:hypothetical protein
MKLGHPFGDGIPTAAAEATGREAEGRAVSFAGHIAGCWALELSQCGRHHRAGMHMDVTLDRS